jgi:hypothetical protein
LLEVTELKGNVPYNASSKNNITTTELNVLLPGIVSKYGAGKFVDIFVQIWSLGSF